MTRHSLTLAALVAAALATPAAAQDLAGWGLAADIGLGAEAEPEWLGAEDLKASPWVIFRNFDVMAPGQEATQDGSLNGFRIGPTLNWRGGRDADDGAALAGLDDVDGTLEMGVRARYTQGAASGYVVARKGLNGHKGWAGTVGAHYRIAPNDRLTLWPGVEGKFGNDRFMRTFFGVNADESARSGYAEHNPGGGFYAVAAKLEGRYALTDSLAVVGEAEYGRLVGDAADAPFIEKKGQPAVRLGLVHRFNLRF